MLSLHFARRYLFAKKSHSVINIIAMVSLLAITMPVAAMVILLSVFNGFEGMIRSMASAFDADLMITPRSGSVIPCERVDTAQLAQIEGVEALSWVVEREALIGYGDHQATVTVRGVEESYKELFPIREAIYHGEYKLQLGDYDYVIMGQGLTYTLGIRTLIHPIEIYALRHNSFSTLLPFESYTHRQVNIAGTFLLEADSEQRYLLTSIRLARELFEMEGSATALLLKVAPDHSSERVKRALEAHLGEEYVVRTRYELRPTFYDIMTYEKWGIFLISLLVLIIAAFSVVGTLVMLILEKRNEETTLRALGADTGLIRRIFIGEGALIGAIALGVGLMLGVGLTLGQEHFGWVKIPVESFIMQSYPVELRWGDLVAIVLLFVGVIGSISLLTVRSMIPTPTQKKKVE
uniref:FtsX-like permease family protein n=1 Tax=Alistipes sp. TaxID=1872444 RepID=UPI004056EC14